MLRCLRTRAPRALRVDRSSALLRPERIIACLLSLIPRLFRSNGCVRPRAPPRRCVVEHALALAYASVLPLWHVASGRGSTLPCAHGGQLCRMLVCRALVRRMPPELVPFAAAGRFGTARVGGRYPDNPLVSPRSRSRSPERDQGAQPVFPFPAKANRDPSVRSRRLPGTSDAEGEEGVAPWPWAGRRRALFNTLDNRRNVFPRCPLPRPSVHRGVLIPLGICGRHAGKHPAEALLRSPLVQPKECSVPHRTFETRPLARLFTIGGAIHEMECNHSLA